MDLGLKDKRAFVGGGSRGIGKAIALELAREGCDVVIASRTKSALDEAAKEIEDITGRKIIPMVLDVTSREDVDRVMAEAASQLGGLDILVNSASLPGGSPGAIGPIDTVVDDELIGDFDVKYVGALRCARAARPLLKKQPWGRIINLSGMAARQAGYAIGSMRNVSVSALTKNLADELGPQGINVTTVHPGMTYTERVPAMLEERAKTQGITVKEAELQMAEGNSIHHIVDAREVAYVIAFLASPKSISINGDAIAAGGGVGRAIHY